MFRRNLFSSQNVSRSQAITNLYLFIVLVALMTLTLGMNLISLADELRRGDPYHSAHFHEFGLCLTLTAIICCAFLIHQLIQRLAKPDSETKADPASL
jgi:uncharacterized membrane protein YidH (DUF202 family)